MDFFCVVQLVIDLELFHDQQPYVQVTAPVKLLGELPLGALGDGQQLELVVHVHDVPLDLVQGLKGLLYRVAVLSRVRALHETVGHVLER